MYLYQERLSFLFERKRRPFSVLCDDENVSSEQLVIESIAWYN